MLSLEVIYYMATENKYVFAFFFFPTQLHWVFIAVHRLSLVAESGGYTLLQSSGSR